MKWKGLSNNQLKILAMITMTVDHVGLNFFPRTQWLRIVGRLALPIYAYMIAEGCRHTRHPLRYLGSLAALAAVCQLVYFFMMDSLYMCILVTFSLSVGLILLIRLAEKGKHWLLWLLPVAALAGVYCLCELRYSDFAIDYGFWGVLLPVLIYAGKGRWGRLAGTAAGLCIVSYAFGGIQWWSLLALPLLALYNGTRGKWKMKWFFYLFYPAHLVVIYLIGILL